MLFNKLGRSSKLGKKTNLPVGFTKNMAATEGIEDKEIEIEAISKMTKSDT